jgi:hypothetical protein
MAQSGHRQVFPRAAFASSQFDSEANQIEHAAGPCVSQVGSGTVRIIRECRCLQQFLLDLRRMLRN